MKAPIIRMLGREDWAQFKALRLKANRSAPCAMWSTYEEEAAQTPEQVQARIEPGPHQLVFGAFDSAELIGIAGMRRERLEQIAHRATVWGLAVDPVRRKEGIAKCLMLHMVAHARAEGILQLQLGVGAGNQPAQALYRALGFKSFGVEPRSMRIGDRFYDEEHMLLRLDE